MNCTAAECHPATGGEFPLVSYNDVITPMVLKLEIKDGGGELIEVVTNLKETDDDERMPRTPPSPPH
jgi:hypothetical protein